MAAALNMIPPKPTLERKIPFEKLLIGPSMVFGEMLTGGHYLEVLRLKKQVSPGPTTYMAMHRAFVAESGFFGAFYRGFAPWGLSQTIKGIPVLFVQGEVRHNLEERTSLPSSSIQPIAGMAGGAAQALFVCPTQKLKVMVVEDARLNAMGTIPAVKEILRKNGVMCVYDGLGPMIFRRAMDWCIRFTVSHKVNEAYIDYKVRHGKEEKLSLPELMSCGMVGGCVSALSHPLDTIITNCQKPMPEGMKNDAISVSKRIYAEFGVKGFYRAMGIKIVDNTYHTMWVYGVGTFVSDSLKRWRDGHH